MAGENNQKQKKSIRVMFGLIMIFVYLSMGVLVLMGFFDWLHEWAKWGLGILFIVYGFWRGYRHFKGINTGI